MSGIISRMRAIGPINYFLGMVARKADSQRLQQEHVDIARAAVLLKGYTWFQNNSSIIDNQRVYQEPPPAEIERFFTDVDRMPPKAVKGLVQKSIEEQVVRMFRKMQECEDAEADKALSLTETVGYEVECRESTIYRAGKGVFVKGAEVVPGTVLAFFPGAVHLNEFARKEEYVNRLLPDDNFNLISRFDGHLIDSRKINSNHNNPYAVGHMINHIPPFQLPNVLQVPFDFTDDPIGYDLFPVELRKFIPNQLIKERTMLGSPDRSAFMYGMVLISCRPLLVGAELFVDYRLNPENEMPKWYRIFDKVSSERRWQDDNPLLGSVKIETAVSTDFEDTTKNERGPN